MPVTRAMQDSRSRAASALHLANCAHLAIVVLACHRGNRLVAAPPVMADADPLNVAIGIAGSGARRNNRSPGMRSRGWRGSAEPHR